MLTPFVEVERAALARVRGDAEQREAHLRRAIELYQAIGATTRAARLAVRIGA